MMFLVGNISLPPTTGLFMPPATAEVIARATRAMMVKVVRCIVRILSRRKFANQVEYDRHRRLDWTGRLRILRQSVLRRLAYITVGPNRRNFTRRFEIPGCAGLRHGTLVLGRWPERAISEIQEW